VVLAAAEGDQGVIGPIVLAPTVHSVRRSSPLHAERKVRMDGPEVFRHAVAADERGHPCRADRAGVSLDDIRLFVYHQANARSRARSVRSGLAPERVVDCIETLGNASARDAAGPLHAAERDGR